ncbi:hypothetical protein LOTGIDRAFT_229988 [Lottia gigantea]|uniref:BHLH domain-containing protein n=1 Tax=Lottia gigantea TaxID=225164 RepID=V4CR11_LOTGI|nr:hypothetical protein LOTGIDRAFT_229988 [Lottia gigantea]ESP04910.1 hypothetical protein LOTGIDRAFT_229988 [Lottia gigantea]
MTTKDVFLQSRAADIVNVVDDDDDDDDGEDDKNGEHTKDLHLPCLLDSVHTESVTDLCSPQMFLDDPYYSSQNLSNNWNAPEEPTVPISLIVADERNCARLEKVIGPCLVDHVLHSCTYDEAYDMCCKTAYYMIWFYLGRPIDHGILAHTTSIRYASKTSRNTILVGVTPSQLSDDLGLHGLAEIVVEPITKPYIFTKYRRWASLTIKDEKPLKPLKIDKIPEATSSNMATNISPDILNNNTTIELPIVTTKPIECISNISNVTNSFVPPTLEKKTSRTNMVPPSKPDNRPRSRSSTKTSSSTPPESPKFPKNCMAADHTIKEKMRRERIKDSCDQLRVLLPYIRGRKTDMASILEMTVDYLKLITSSLPPDFQSQIIAMMTAGTLVEPHSKSDSTSRSSTSSSTSSRKNSRSKDPPSPSLSKVTSSSDIGVESTAKMVDIETDINGNLTEMNRTMPLPESSPGSFSNLKRTDSIDVTDAMPAKRMLMSSGPAQSSMLYITSDDNRKECGITLDNAHDDVFQNHIQPIRVPQSHWTDMYSMSGYPQLAGPAGSRMTARDRDSYGMFMDSYYHYYTGQQSSGYGGNPLSEYVNPNAVLPMTYTRIPENSRAYDDNDRFTGSSQVDDVYSMSSATNPT